MSDESLDDVHAFTDLQNVVKQMKIPSDGNLSSMGSSSASSRSREGSVAGSFLDDGNFLLETLKEFDDENEEEEDDDDADKNDDVTNTSTYPAIENKLIEDSKQSHDFKESVSSMTIAEES